MVSGPELIQKVFNSDTCMEKPYIAYGLFNLDYGLLASRCKCPEIFKLKILLIKIRMHRES